VASALRERIGANLDRQRASIVERRRSERKRAWGVFAVAAAVPVVLWAATRASHVDERHASRAAVIETRGSTAIAGDEVSTGGDGSARASLACGAVVDVGSSSRVSFTPPANDRAENRIELAQGKVEVQVPKLPRGTDLRVRTVEATIVVHGTRFTVERVALAGGPSETRVTVTDGLVEVDAVDGVHMLGAGTAIVEPPQSPEVATPPASLAVGNARPNLAAPSSAPTGGSTLATENALLSEAMRLHREHRVERALARLDDFLARYPSSPLAETARAERLRIMTELSDAAVAHGP
jgi:ferric-dicitrate binding protein FerR (iron transport regulator)